jgi:hypothetical protein
MKIVKFFLLIFVLAFASISVHFGLKILYKYRYENAVLKEMVQRLEADSRIAEVLVTKVEYDEIAKTNLTTIKFLEYDTKGTPLSPKYFTFTGNIIQFQSLVIRFDDLNVRSADRMRGKSAYIFWKAFMLNGKDTQEFEINPIGKVPEGYRIEKEEGYFERRLWEKFWNYVFDPNSSSKAGIKSAQIEAPGTMFIPGFIYKLKIEHDGGIRIDTEPLPPILRNETIP